MPIEFLDLLDDGGWEPLALDATDPGSTWSEGGLLRDAPVDPAATFDGARRATGIDPSFGLTGLRLPRRFTVPRQHHNLALLLLVVDGSVTVGTDDSADELRSGRYCVVEAGTPYRLAAGAHGVTYLSSWPQEGPGLETCWYPDPAWARAEAATR